ncbi:MAG: ATP-binding protein [Aquisalimonadaceae bacterium]
MAKAPMTSARQAVLGAAILTLAGSIVGITLGRSAGSVTGYEVWLVLSSLVFSAGLLAILIVKPFDRIEWVAPVTSTFFLLYLSVGSLLSIDKSAITNSFLVYLLWFFALMAFNRFVNVARHSAPLTLAIYLIPNFLIAGRLALYPNSQSEIGVLAVYCLSYATFALVLGLFARYREAYIQEHERSRALQVINKAVRASEGQFRQLFDNAASGVGWLSLDGVCLHVNATFAHMMAKPMERLHGLRFGDLVHPEDSPVWESLLEEMRRGEKRDYDAELRLQADTGQSLWTRLSFAQVTKADGDPEALAFVCLDNTEVHEMEARLRESQRLEAVGQLTGGIAHDFNNLLTVILGNAESLEETLPKDSHHAELAAMTRMAAERGARLTSQLLAFSSRQPLAAEVTDVGQLVSDLQGLLSRSLGGHIETDVAQAEDLWPTLVDQPQLENALLNLCINARDAMPDGGRLTIGISNTRLNTDYADRNHGVAAGEYVLLTVSDSGMGMPPAVQARIFEPFFTTKQRGKGTGLGMAMVYGFIKQSAGHVSIESEPGHGTTVKLYLPRYVDESISSAAG